MSEVNVYEQFFSACHTAAGVPRHAALVMLIARSEAGHIRYESAVTFFAHNDPEDYAVSYDDYHSVTLYDAEGRRSKKREAALLEGFRKALDDICGGIDAEIFWDKPLREARRG